VPLLLLAGPGGRHDLDHGCVHAGLAAGVTTPAPPQQYPPGQQPPPPSLAPAAEAALVTAIAGLLLTAVSAAAVIEALKLRFTLSQDMWSALSGSAGVAMASPPPVTGVIGPASAQTGRQNLARRAQFVVSSAKRLMSDIAAWRAGHRPPPEPPPPPGPAAGQAADLNLLRRGQFAEAKRRRLAADIARGQAGDTGPMQALQAGLNRERRYYGLHLAAMWNRSVAAGKTDMAALEHGNLLSWNAVMDDRTSAECRAADRKNYRASVMPAIGWPGSVHPHCRCYAGPPTDGARLLP